jgi:hypothetical protein
MDHAPIYRSAARRTTTSLIPWQRTASLASAAVALTMSGIALGYQGFANTTSATPAGATTSASTQLDPTTAGRNTAVPVPSISVVSTDGGHPDVISTLSSALIAQFQTAQVPILDLPVAALVQPFVGPLALIGPQPTAEPFVLPAISLEPSVAPADLALDVAAPPLADDPAPVEITEAAVMPDVILPPLVSTRAASLLVAPADVQTTADEPVADAQPQEQVAAAAVVQAEPAPAPAPAPAAPPARSAAPVHVATAVPVVHTAAPVVVKPAPQPEDEAPPAPARRVAPPVEPAPAPAAHATANDHGNSNGNAARGNNQDDNAPAHGSAAKGDSQPNKGKGGGNGSDHGG